MAIADVVKNELEAAIGSHNVATSLEALTRASKDETHGLVPIMPDAVVFPQSHDDVVKIAATCFKYGVVMTPRGAGTGKSGGCVPVNGGVVIDFSKLNKVLSINPMDLTAVVEPGVILRDFQGQADEAGLFYPPDPASLDWCTLGGNVAENAGGPSAVKYGVTKDYVLALRIVLADGRSFRIGKQTIKGVTGLDLPALICGSEGVLAMVTEITIRLLPKPPHVLSALLRFSSRQSAIDAVARVRGSGAVPRCIEFMDSSSLNALKKTGMLPASLSDVSALLLVECDGHDEESVLRSLSLADASASGEGYLGASIAVDESQRQKLWSIRRQLSEATKKLAKFKISEDIVVPLSKMSEFLDDVDVIANNYGVQTCSFGHAGDGNLHVQILFDDDQLRSKMPSLLAEIFSATLARNGTLTGEHGIGVAKQPYLALEQEEGLIDLQRQIKAVFDPSLLLNPGKFL